MADETSPESDARASESFDVQDADAAEIRDTDIQFDCPQCGKSLFKARGGVYKCLDANCGFERKGKKKKAEDDE